MNSREGVGLSDMSDRKVVLKMVLSLDGFATSPDGTHEWMFEWFGDDSGEWNRRALGEAGPGKGSPQLRDHGPALGRVRGADRNRDEREAEGCLLPPWRRRNGDRPRSS